MGARKLSDIGARIIRHPAFRWLDGPSLTPDQVNQKKEELDSLRYIGDYLVSDGWKKGMKPLIDSLIEKYDKIADSDSASSDVSEKNRQRKIGLKSLYVAIEEAVKRAEMLTSELQREEKENERRNSKQ